tara:strand:- start:70 stop:534 length:465 start_codon:yes stop_codon:yes gene_type:complete
MFSFKKYHIILFIFLITIISTSCKLQEPVKHHGILHLKNRAELVKLNKSNKNDVIKIIGQPHTLSTFSENEWVYFERTLTKGEFLKLGKNVLKTNNVLILSFDKYGILKDKNFLDKSSKNDITFSEKTTENNLKQKSFVERFLSSLRNKMYGRK